MPTWFSTTPASLNRASPLSASSGTLGEVGNCQVTVNCHCAERTIAWPVATRLYLPKEWANDWPRCDKAKVPEEVTFAPKPSIALDLLDSTDEMGVVYSCVVADADYGDNAESIMALEALGQSGTWDTYWIAQLRFAA